MSAIQALSRPLLLLHGVVNMAQGLFCITTPDKYIEAAGPAFKSASREAVQAIGLGTLGVGVYGALGAYANDRWFFGATVPLRLAFVCVMFFGAWDVPRQMLAYELSIAAMALVACVYWQPAGALVSFGGKRTGTGGRAPPVSTSSSSTAGAAGRKSGKKTK